MPLTPEQRRINKKNCDRAYYLKNQEKLKAKVKDYREANPEAQKKYREDNKEKIAENKKIYNEANKEKIAETTKKYVEANKEKIAENLKRYREKFSDEEFTEKNRIYRKTTSGIKSQILGGWKGHGIIGDLSFIYDTIYLPTTHCNVCNKVFKNSMDKCADHNHNITDEYNFRQVLCRQCNTKDFWRKHNEWV